MLQLDSIEGFPCFFYSFLCLFEMLLYFKGQGYFPVETYIQHIFYFIIAHLQLSFAFMLSGQLNILGATLINLISLK